jgi:hypothetical protein
MAWPVDWDRGSVLGAIEQASGVALDPNDDLPDTLIAKAQELRLEPIHLRMWIFDQPKAGWNPQSLTSWARRNGISAAPEGEQMPTEELIIESRPFIVRAQKACHFYGRHMASVGVMVESGGNECALITSSFAPCSMELNHAEPRWELCLRNPDNNGTGANQ